MRVEMKPELYQDLIESLGNNILWYRGCVCSCIDRLSGQPNPVCPICHGEGYRYLAPIKAVVGVTSLTGNYTQLVQELTEFGSAYITPKKEIIMGYKDKIEFVDFRCVYSEPLHIDFDYDGKGISPETKRNILSVIFCADDKFEFQEGIDFVVTEDKHHIRFLSEFAIELANNKDLSFLYYTTPIYIVDNILHELRATRISVNSPNGEPYTTELPKQYHIHRLDFDYGVSKPMSIAVPPRETVVLDPNDNLVENFITAKDKLPTYPPPKLESVEECPVLPPNIKARRATEEVEI